MGTTHSPAMVSRSHSGLEKDPIRIGVTRSMDTVLVVEDSRAMQRTLQRLFESDSLQVQIASDGPSGAGIVPQTTALRGRARPQASRNVRERTVPGVQGAGPRRCRL